MGRRARKAERSRVGRLLHAASTAARLLFCVLPACWRHPRPEGKTGFGPGRFSREITTARSLLALPHLGGRWLLSAHLATTRRACVRCRFSVRPARCCGAGKKYAVDAAHRPSGRKAAAVLPPPPPFKRLLFLSRPYAVRVFLSSLHSAGYVLTSPSLGLCVWLVVLFCVMCSVSSAAVMPPSPLLPGPVKPERDQLVACLCAR